MTRYSDHRLVAGRTARLAGPAGRKMISGEKIGQAQAQVYMGVELPVLCSFNGKQYNTDTFLAVREFDFN